MNKVIQCVIVIGVVGQLAGLGAQAAPPVPEFKEGLWRQDGKPIRCTLTDDAVIIRSGTTTTTMPYLSITSITYDRRRSGTGWSPLTGIGSNSVDHWLTIQHTDKTTGGYYTFRMGEIVVNRLLGNLEARSGHTIERAGG